MRGTTFHSESGSRVNSERKDTVRTINKNSRISFRDVFELGEYGAKVERETQFLRSNGVNPNSATSSKADRILSKMQ